MNTARRGTGHNGAAPATKRRVVPEEVSAHAVKRAYERAVTALQEYRDILGTVANGADRSYAANDADDFAEVIAEIRTLAENARSEDDEGGQSEQPEAERH